MSKVHTRLKLEKQLYHAEQLQRSLYKQLIAARQHEQLKLTDHAVVRFFERYKKVPLYEVAQEAIITDAFLQLWKQCGHADGTYLVPDTGVTIVIENNIIATVLP